MDMSQKVPNRPLLFSHTRCPKKEISEGNWRNNFAHCPSDSCSACVGAPGSFITCFVGRKEGGGRVTCTCVAGRQGA